MKPRCKEILKGNMQYEFKEALCNQSWEKNAGKQEQKEA